MSTASTVTSLQGDPRRFRSERMIAHTLRVCALLSVLTTVGIVLVLMIESSAFFRQVPLTDFLFGTQWAPSFKPASYGVLPLLCGTFLIVVGSSLVAIPIGLISAIYLAEYASPKARSVLKPILEVLAGVPTIVYGYFALTFVTPIIQLVLPAEGFNALSASIVVGIMVLPMVASLCDDALRAVPVSLRQSAYALGATSLEVSTRVVVPAALSGVVASFVLAISRAIGETMAVTLAAGANPNLTLNPLQEIQTMTAYIVQTCFGEAEHGSPAYNAIFGVAALLFVITLMANVFAHRILRRYREVYE